MSSLQVVRVSLLVNWLISLGNSWYKILSIKVNKTQEGTDEMGWDPQAKQKEAQRAMLRVNH